MKSIRELLTGRAPLVVPGSMSTLDAARLMREEHVGCLLVLDAARKPLGIFTERDLMVRVIVEGRKPAEVQVKEVMSRDPFTADAEKRVLKTARAMQERHIRHLPVLDESEGLIGVLSLRDLLRAMLDEKRDEAKALRAYIQGEADA